MCSYLLVLIIKTCTNGDLKLNGQKRPALHSKCRCYLTFRFLRNIRQKITENKLYKFWVLIARFCANFGQTL